MKGARYSRAKFRSEARVSNSEVAQRKERKMAVAIVMLFHYMASMTG